MAECGDNDIRYMRRALQLARGGELHASPNPMVGAVITAGDRIIGEGFHRRCGEGHAEVNAVNSIRERQLLKEATVYVTLEPCSHYGKTPPCAKLLIDSGIKRVVIGSPDPFPLVAGRGEAMLREAGIEVTTGVLENECKALNRKFMTAHTLGRPFITLKWAESADGFMDRKRRNNEKACKFSTPLTSVIVHRMRAVHDAIMVGSGTFLADNPALTVRHWGGNDPRRIVMDRSGILSDVPSEWLHITGQETLAETLHNLYEREKITSILVEGGPTLLRSFLSENLWDAARIEKAPFTLGDQGDSPAPSISLSPATAYTLDSREILLYQNRSFAI